MMGFTAISCSVTAQIINTNGPLETPGRDLLGSLLGLLLCNIFGAVPI